MSDQKRWRKAAIAYLLTGMLVGSAVLAAGLAPGVQPQQGAERAYQEMAARDYKAAIQDFQKALTEAPSNSQWRKDLGYAEVAAGLPWEARKEFETVYREHPEELGIALELAYLLQQQHEDDAAVRYFAAAAKSTDAKISKSARAALANLDASLLHARKQKAYDLLAQGHRAEAIRLFEEVREADSADATTTLQLGYLYDAAGDLPKAREMFQAARYNPDPAVSVKASAALAEVQRQSAWWFGTVYAAPFYESRFANQINPLNTKIGLRPSTYLQPYFGLRFTRDIRSTTGTLPQIFSDNSAVFSLGVQSTILGHGTNLYAEAGTALSLLDRPHQGRAVPDYRAGVTWFQPWGVSLARAALLNERGISLTGSAYGDVGFYSRYQHNVIGYLQLREGLNLPTGRVLPIQVLAAVNLVRDSNGNFYNNVVEAGPEVRLAPFRRLPDLQIEAEYLRGFYAVHDPVNPYGPRYGDCRLFLIWSKHF